MAQEGLLLRVDGSRRDWLESRGPILTLVGGIDDATSRVTGATFRMAEDAAGYFLMLAQTARRARAPGGHVLGPRSASARSWVCVRQCFYSVPAWSAGRTLTARIGDTAIEVTDAGSVVARHERSTVRGSRPLC